MTVTIQLDEQDTNLFTGFARANAMTISEFFKESAFRMVEDAYDVADAKEILAETGETYLTPEEVAKELGFDNV